MKSQVLTAIHGAEIMVQCSWNDSEQITLLHGLNIVTEHSVISIRHSYIQVCILCIDTLVL